jgi:hypothetical protein
MLLLLLLLLGHHSLFCDARDDSVIGQLILRSDYTNGSDVMLIYLSSTVHDLMLFTDTIT